MQPLQPEQAAFLFSIALPSLKREHTVTKKVIDAIPLDKGDYRPDPVSKSALDLAWHIAAAEYRFMEGAASGKFDFNGPVKPESIRNSAGVSAWFSESFNTNLQRLMELSPEQLNTLVDFRGMMQLPAVAYLQLCISHEVHHRGQLSMYLRPMGAKVPSIYGESYDDTKAREAGLSKAENA